MVRKSRSSSARSWRKKFTDSSEVCRAGAVKGAAPRLSGPDELRALRASAIQSLSGPFNLEIRPFNVYSLLISLLRYYRSPCSSRSSLEESQIPPINPLESAFTKIAAGVPLGHNRRLRSVRSASLQQIHFFHTVAASCSLLPLFFAFVSFIFNHLQPLLPKIGGGVGGQAARPSGLFK